MAYSFTHLHVHSEYSKLDGMARVGDMFDLVLQRGGDALAITDHGTLSAMWQARAHSERTGVKVIPGIEAYVAIGTRFERKKIEVPADDSAAEGGQEEQMKGTRSKKRAYEHLTILARNDEGWENLVQLQNESSKHTYGRAKLIDYELLEQHSNGLMILTGCIGGPVFGPLSRAVAAEKELASFLPQGSSAREAAEICASYSRMVEAVELLRMDSAADTEELREAEESALSAKNQIGGLAERGADMQVVIEVAERAHYERARANANLERLIHAVGQENVYVEVMEHGNSVEQDTLPQLRELAAHYGLPLVATNDSHHTDKEHSVAHAAWLAVGSDSTLADPKFSFHGTGYHLRTQEEMECLVAEEWWFEACRSTQTVADRVERGIIPDPELRLPEFPAPEGYAHVNDFLQKLIHDGISSKLGGELKEEYRDRLNFEYSTIVSMGFVSYFLIVWEMISWTRSQGSLVGPGRGSAAGSLVAYLLDITDVDPIEYGLLFERFLEPGRAELPDIDVDFEARFKQRVIQHLMDLWGQDCVAQIGSIGRPKIKGSWKKALAALGQNAAIQKRTAKALPESITANELISSRQTGEVVRDDSSISTREFWKETEKLPCLDQALELMGAFYEVAFSASGHASGVIISPVPLTDMIPMRWHKPDSADFYRWVTEWDYRDIEKFGLVKFDVLAIRNLDMAAVCMESIKRLGVELSLKTIPHPDHDSYDAQVRRGFNMLQNGRTAGVFQLESPAMTQLLEEVATENLGELSAVVALFRPGPLSAGMDKKYADRKHGREVVSYDYLSMDPVEQQWLNTVLGTTYGTMIYQEQVMDLGRVVAGFDDAWRSKLRKAVSKKIKSVMAEVGAKFIEGATQEFRNEITGEVYSPVFSANTAERVWEAMKGSAEYLFNKSHSVAYALIAYYTAYLKANFPGDYGAATLSVTGSDKPVKRVAAMNALIGEGMGILPPDVNLSAAITLPAGDHDVRIGLSEIKSFGAAADVIGEREARGPFTSLDNLLTRVKVGDDRRSMPTNMVEALIDSGALDAFGSRMGMHVVAKAGDLSDIPIPEIEFSAVELGVRQSSRLLMTLDPDVRREIQQTLTGWERPGGDPAFRQPTATPVSELVSLDVPDGSLVYISGILSEYTEKSYSRGVMGSLELSDTGGSLMCVIWEEERMKARANGDIPPVGFPVVVFGRLETRTFTTKALQGDEDGGSVNADGEVEEDHEKETEVTRRQVSVRSIHPISVDLSPKGYMPASSLPEIDLVSPVDGQLIPAPIHHSDDPAKALIPTAEAILQTVAPQGTQLRAEPSYGSAASAQMIGPNALASTASKSTMQLTAPTQFHQAVRAQIDPIEHIGCPEVTTVPHLTAVPPLVEPEVHFESDERQVEMPGDLTPDEKLRALLNAGTSLPIMG